MAQHPQAFRALVDQEHTRPLAGLPDPEAGTDRVDDAGDLTRPMAALPDPGEPGQAGALSEVTRQMNGLVNPDDAEAEDSSLLTRPMAGLADLWDPADGE